MRKTLDIARMADRAHRDPIINLENFLPGPAERQKQNPIAITNGRDRTARRELRLDVFAPVRNRFDPTIWLFDHATVLLKSAAIFFSGRVVMPSRETILITGKIFRVAIHAARRRVRFGRRIQRAQRHRDRFIFAQFFAAAFFPTDFRNARMPRTAGEPSRSRRIPSLQIARPSRRKNKAAPTVGPRIVSGEDRNDDADALQDEAKIIPQQFRKRAHFSVHTHFLQLRAPEKLKRMLEHARHFPRRRRHARDRHDRMPIDLEHFIRAIVNNGVAGRGAPISRHQHSAAKLKREDGGGFRRHPRWVLLPAIKSRRTGARKPRRRSNAGKSSLAPDTLWSNTAPGRSIIGPFAGDSASIGSDRPCAFSSGDPWYPVAKYQVLSGAAAVIASLFRSPRHSRFLHAIRHGKNLGTIPEKANRAVEGGALATVKARCQHDYDENPGDSGVGRISPCPGVGANA